MERLDAQELQHWGELLQLKDLMEAVLDGQQAEDGLHSTKKVVKSEKTPKTLKKIWKIMNF